MGSGVYGRGEETRVATEITSNARPYDEWGEGRGTPGAGGASTRAHNNNTLLARAAPLGLYLCKISEAALAGK